MAAAKKKPSRQRRTATAEPAVIYRGIRIAPISGKRSPLAEAIREGFLEMYEKLRAEPDKD